MMYKGYTGQIKTSKHFCADHQRHIRKAVDKLKKPEAYTEMTVVIGDVY